MTRLALRLVILAAILTVAPAWVAAQTPQAQKPAAKAAAATVINLNTATVEQLDGLPGVGQKLAARIVEYRQKNGPFKKVEDLMNVKGIGEKNFLKLRSRLTVGGGAPGVPDSR